MPSTIASGARIGDAGVWAARACYASAGKFWVFVESTSGGGIQAMKSTDGVTWTEQDAADSPTASSTNTSYAISDNAVSNLLAIHYGSSDGANHSRVRTYNISTDQWTSTDINSAAAYTDVSESNNLRVTQRSDGDIVIGFKVNSNGDVAYRRWDGSAWNTATAVSGGGADGIICDILVDSDNRSWFIYSDTTNNDFTYRSLSSADVLGTETDFDATAHTTARIRGSSGIFYNAGGTNRIAVLKRDTGGELDLHYGDTGAATLANLTVVDAVSTSTSPNPTMVGLTVVGTVIHACWSTANTILRDVSDDLTTPAFGSDTTVLSSLTDADPMPQWINDGTYYGIVYQDNGAVNVEWINAPPAGTAPKPNPFNRLRHLIVR